MLWTEDIDRELGCIFRGSNHFTYRGCHPSLRGPLEKASVYVVNSDAVGMGVHWLYMDVDRGGRASFFDSFAVPPEHYRKRLGRHLENCDPHYWQSHRIVQELTSTACGHHIIYFAQRRAVGMTADEVLSTYTDNLAENDAIAKEATTCGPNDYR